MVNGKPKTYQDAMEGLNETQELKIFYQRIMGIREETAVQELAEHSGLLSLKAKTILLTTVHDLKYYDYFDEVWYLSKSAKTNNRSVYTVFATQYCLEKIFDAYMKSLN